MDGIKHVTGKPTDSEAIQRRRAFNFTGVLMTGTLTEYRDQQRTFQTVEMLEGTIISGEGEICGSCFLPADFLIPALLKSGKPLVLCFVCAERHIRKMKRKSREFRADILIDPGGRLRGIHYD